MNAPVAARPETPASELTIAVTLYDRRRYILGAVASALEQSIPAARVMVIEDHGPDEGLRDLVLDRFGGSVDYVRNPRRRGLFGNWNACLEACRTRWLSILHDDDLLHPWFVESACRWLELKPDRGIYFGSFEVMDEAGGAVEYPRHPVEGELEDIDVSRLAESNTLGFPGHLMDVALARELGGFRERSLFCGDWEMWLRLALERGGARAARVVTRVRFYDDVQRGTSKVMRTGRCFGLTIVQRKRHRSWMAAQGLIVGWSKRRLRSYGGPFPRFLLRYAGGWEPRWLDYNSRLFLVSDCGGPAAWMLRLGVRLFGARSLAAASRIYRRFGGVSRPLGRPSA